MFNIEVTIPEIFTVRGGQRLVNEALKDAWLKVGEKWHKDFRPKHFTHAGAREYGYEWRAGERSARGSRAWRRSYTGRKYRKFGHTLPLVYTGESRATSAIRRIVASKDGVVIRMRTRNFNYKYALQKGPDGKAFGSGRSKIDMNKELLTISPRERDELVSVFDKSLDRNFQRLIRQNIVKIKI